MLNKLESPETIYSQREIASTPNLKQKPATTKNVERSIYPLKFPKRLIRKPTQQTMLSETSQNPEIPCLKISEYANCSRCFEGSFLPLRESEIMARQPTHHFFKQKKLALPGGFSHLSRQSGLFPLQLSTYENVGTLNNSNPVCLQKQINYDSMDNQDKEYQSKSHVKRMLNETFIKNNHIEDQDIMNRGAKSARSYFNKYRESNDKEIQSNLSNNEQRIQSKILKCNK